MDGCIAVQYTTCNSIPRHVRLARGHDVQHRLLIRDSGMNGTDALETLWGGSTNRRRLCFSIHFWHPAATARSRSIYPLAPSATPLQTPDPKTPTTSNTTTPANPPTLYSPTSPPPSSAFLSRIPLVSSPIPYQQINKHGYPRPEHPHLQGSPCGRWWSRKDHLCQEASLRRV